MEFSRGHIEFTYVDYIALEAGYDRLLCTRKLTQVIRTVNSSVQAGLLSHETFDLESPDVYSRVKDTRVTRVTLKNLFSAVQTHPDDITFAGFEIAPLKATAYVNSGMLGII